MLVALRVTVFCLFVYYYFDVVAILYRKQEKTCQEESTSNRKHKEASGGVSRLQEDSQDIRKAQHQKIINKQTKYSDSEAKTRL